MAANRMEHQLASIPPVQDIEGALVVEVFRCIEDTADELEFLEVGVLTDDAVDFVKSVFREAVLTRLPEAREAGLPVSTNELLLEYLRQIVVKLSTTAARFSENRTESSLPSIGPIHLLQSIQIYWCNIWPFCRPMPENPPGPTVPPKPSNPPSPSNPPNTPPPSGNRFRDNII